jgi:hypothetical protein
MSEKALEWWQLIYEKGCSGQSHSQEDDCYNEVSRPF